MGEYNLRSLPTKRRKVVVLGYARLLKFVKSVVEEELGITLPPDTDLYSTSDSYSSTRFYIQSESDEWPDAPDDTPNVIFEDSSDSGGAEKV